MKRTEYTISRWKRIVNVVLAGALVCAVIGTSTTTAPKTAQASQPVGDVIYNYPYAPAPQTVPASPTDINWTTTVDHNDPSANRGGVPIQGYEQAYTQAQSATYNGTATPDHVVMSDDAMTGGVVSFYGYGIMPYADEVFSSNSGSASQGLSFTLNPVVMNFHAFSESGYLFNGQMTTGADGNTYYTGYAVILSCANSAGMQENDPNAPNTASLGVYYINNELWNTESFTPGNVATTRTLIATLVTGITNLSTTTYRVSVEIDPATRAFSVFLNGQQYANVSASQVQGGANGPTGFGFYTGYYAHNCSILTVIRYEDVSPDLTAFVDFSGSIY